MVSETPGTEFARTGFNHEDLPTASLPDVCYSKEDPAKELLGINRLTERG